MPQKMEYTVLDMIESAVRQARVQPLNLGGLGGAGGGDGGPPGGFIGQLPQRQVTYDTTEAATLFTPASGMSLVDNLNHIRYRIQEIETVISGGVSGSIAVMDYDGNPTIDPATTIVFSGAVVTDLGGGAALVVFTGGGGGSSFTGDASSVVLTDALGALDTVPWLKWGTATRPYIEFGADVAGKETNAGRIGYGTFGSDSFFYIVGAGTTGGDRWVRIYDKLEADLVKSPIQIPSMTSEVVLGTDSSGNIIGGTTGADGRYTQTAHDHTGGDGGAIFYTGVIGTFLSGVSVPASTTHYTCPLKDTTNTTQNQLPWPENGTLSDMIVRIAGGGQPASGSLVITLMINGVASSIVVTIAAGSAGGSYSDTTHTETISAGDLLMWRIVNNATAASATFTAITMKITKQTE